MNERIRQLAEQAKKYSLDAMIKIADKEQALKVYSESYDTKFAELIIAECLNRVRDEIQYIVDWDKADHVVREVKKHFGVENG